MDDSPSLSSRGLQILQVAKKDKAAAQQALAELSLAEQVAVLCEAPLARRVSLLELAPMPEDLIPLIPEAELCFTVKAAGLADASWILEHATPEQVVACADLDAWQGLAPNVEAFARWVDLLAEAGEEPLVAAARSFDSELVVLFLRHRIEAFLKPSGDDDWQPPEAGQTLDGQFYFRAREADDDVVSIISMLRGLFEKDYWLYFRLMQGVNWELQSDLEEWALRWRTGRLEDLGFPSWDHAMRIYGFVRPDKRTELSPEATCLDAEAWDLPVWIPELPAAVQAEHLLFRVIGELTEEERRSFFYGFMALANKIAVADAMSLGDAETLPTAIEKAVLVLSEALEFVAKDSGVGHSEVLRRTTLEKLFRVGVSMKPEHLPFRAVDEDNADDL